MIAEVGSEDLLLGQDLPENDCTQTFGFLNPARGRHPRFSSLQGSCSMGEQTGVAQDSVLPVPAPLGVGSHSGSAPEPSPVREQACLVQRASGERGCSHAG